MRIDCGHGAWVDEDAIELRFVRASGPGGQNVNKVSTAVELRFDVGTAAGLTQGAKARLAVLAGRRLTQDGVLVLQADEHRTQELNRAAAIARLLALVAEAAPAPRRRRPTRPTRASVERRIGGKTRRAGVKAGRGRPPPE